MGNLVAKWTTDCSRLLVDETGTDDAVLERAEEYHTGKRTKFFVHRVELERFKMVTDDDGDTYMVPLSYATSWPFAPSQYVPWFFKSLESIADTHGTTAAELIEQLCGDAPGELANAYECIGGHHGFDNLDAYPLSLTVTQLDKRWVR